MLTGAMVAIAPGSPVQLFTALLVCLAYLLLVLHAVPYKGRLEDRLAFLVALCLTLSLAFGLVLIMDNPVEPVFYPTTVGIVLIVINIFPFAYGIHCTIQIVRFGANYAILRQGAATMTGRRQEDIGVDEGTKLDGLGSDGEERGGPSRPPRIKIQRQLSVAEMRRAVEHEQVVVLQATSNKHREAHIARIKEREARADARVKARLVERTAAKARIGRGPGAIGNDKKKKKDEEEKEKEKEKKKNKNKKRKEKKKTVVMPVVDLSKAAFVLVPGSTDPSNVHAMSRVSGPALSRSRISNGGSPMFTRDFAATAPSAGSGAASPPTPPPDPSLSALEEFINFRMHFISWRGWIDLFSR